VSCLVIVRHDAVYRTESGAPGLISSAAEALDGNAVVEWTFEGCELEQVAAEWPSLTIVRLRLALAGVAVGALARLLLDHGRRRAVEREQFGQPLAGFQAVRHLLAGVLLDVEAIELAADEALESLGAPRGTIAALSAKLVANEAGPRVGRVVHQVCGGAGYLEDAGLGPVTRAIHALVTGIGPSNALRAELIAALAGDPTGVTASG
jgi:alkylation response protein AidB-like acyl-CoA dehydrogenase